MAKEFAYCSSGCNKPQFDKQIDSINHRYPNAIIIKEPYSRTVTDRTELKKLMAQLEKDDTLIVNSMDRLSRDPDQLLSYYTDLSEKGVRLIFINQPYMDTDVYMSACKDMMGDSSLSENRAIKKGLHQLLASQISRILEKSREDLQDHRSMMKKSHDETGAEEKPVTQVKGKKYESRKSLMVKELIRQYNQNFDGSMNDIQTMEQIRNDMGTISRNTYYKYKKELAGESFSTEE